MTGPIDIFTLWCRSDAWKVKIGDFKSLVVTLKAHMITGDMQEGAKSVYVVYCELTSIHCWKKDGDETGKNSCIEGIGEGKLGTQG